MIYISIYDLNTKIDQGCTSIGIFRSSDISGTFNEITDVASRILLTNTEYYTYNDDGPYWYKVKLFKDEIPCDSFETTNPFRANTSDLTEDLRHIIEDIGEDQRYTIKQLRRFVKIAAQHLQLTKYINRFKTDYDGIISPTPSNMDINVILTQARIEIIDAQRLNAADTNILFSDGRGRFNNRTSEALRADKKELTAERNLLIYEYNKLIGSDVARIER
jgi:hypothetical protein